MRSARSPEALTRPAASASTQVSSPVASAIQRAPGVPDARNRLHRGVRRDPDLDGRARRPLGEDGEEVLAQQPQVGPVGTEPAEPRERVRDRDRVGGAEPGRTHWDGSSDGLDPPSFGAMLGWAQVSSV